jgi:hypothetical protein
MAFRGDIHIHIHVPGVNHIPAILSELKALDAETPPVPTGAQATVLPTLTDHVPGSPWGRARLEWLHRIIWSAQRAIVTCIANASANDTVATRQQLVTAITAAAKQPQNTKNLAANLAWLSRYAVTVTGHKKGPYTEKDLGPQYSEGERHTYAMDKSDAQAWLEIVAAQK